MTKTHQRTDNPSFPTFGSLAAAAGALGIPSHVLRAAKRKGAAGFLASNRVDAAKLLRWCLTRGKTFAPGVNLEEAKAKLAEVQAHQIERDMHVAGGELVPVGWVFEVVDRAFASPALNDWLYSRTTLLAYRLYGIARDLGKAGEVEAKRLLDQDAREVALVVGDARRNILADLRRGPEECDKETIFGKTVRLLEDAAKSLTPDARAQVHAALKRFHEKENTAE